MNKAFSKGFTLIELVAIVILIGILVGIGIWRIGGLKDEAVSLSAQDALAAVTRMEELASMEGLATLNNESLARLKELQMNLASKGHAYNKLDPNRTTNLVCFDQSSGAWRLR